jgi:hypothetical protein
MDERSVKGGAPSAPPDIRNDKRYKIRIQRPLSRPEDSTVRENVILTNPRVTSAEVSKHQPWRDITREQREDAQYRTLMDYANEGIIPICPIERIHLQTKEEYVVHEGVLYHIESTNKRNKTADDEMTGDYHMQLCVTPALRSKLIKDYHVNLGHAGATSIFESLRPRYWWPNMRRDVELVISECDICQRYKDHRPVSGKISMQLVEEAGRPWETIWIDFIGPYGTNKTEKKNCCALVIVDDFSRWMEASSCTNADSLTVATILRSWCLRHGFPRHVKSDRGSNLISSPLQQLYSTWGVKKTESASLHPRSHGKVERANKHIQETLRTLTAGGTAEWDTVLEQATASWNWSHKGLTGVSPYQIVHGLRPRLQFNT